MIRLTIDVESLQKSFLVNMAASMDTDPVQNDIKRLEDSCRQLTDAIDEIQHEIRRCSDALERAGGHLPEQQRRMLELCRNRDLNIEDLRAAQVKLHELRLARESQTIL